jgi:hypothetical protein
MTCVETVGGMSSFELTMLSYVLVFAAIWVVRRLAVALRAAVRFMTRHE